MALSFVSNVLSGIYNGSTLGLLIYAAVLSTDSSIDLSELSVETLHRNCIDSRNRFDRQSTKAISANKLLQSERENTQKLAEGILSDSILVQAEAFGELKRYESNLKLRGADVGPCSTVRLQVYKP